MWSRHHLQDAAEHLSSQSLDAIYLSQSIPVSNSSRQGVGPSIPLITALGDNLEEKWSDYWRWGISETLVNSLLVTALNMWTLVGSTTLIREAFATFLENPVGHDSDRFMVWRLSTIAPLIVGREVGLFCRRHNRSGGDQLLQEKRDYFTAIAENYTRRILSEAEAKGIDGREIWKSSWERLENEDKRLLIRASVPGAAIPLLELLEPEFRDLATQRVVRPSSNISARVRRLAARALRLRP